MDRLGPGAVLLKPPEQGPPPRTTHLISLQGCQAGMYVILDQENKCIGYKLIIMDPNEFKRYEFEFGDDVRQQWETEIGEWPLLGEVPKQIAEATSGGPDQ
jgi:hypothetical protein